MKILKRFLILTLVLNLGGTGVITQVNAAVIGTYDVIQGQERQMRLDQLDELLAQDAVRDGLAKMGVDPEQARLRVQALTDEEIERLAKRMDAMPAGGSDVLVVIGIVFLVLLILEIVGVTDIFKRV